MNAGTQMVHIQNTDYTPHVQVQFEGQSFTSFVKSDELKEFLLG